jgi:glycosyltransferase involved in cell wall biosynthesis
MPRKLQHEMELYLRIALDATYSIGNTLTGIGIYSAELMRGLADAHPETRFDFCYRPHRYLRSWKNTLPPNARRCLLSEPLGPRGADLFHGLNQRLPKLPLRRSVATFYDLFVMTREYATPEFRARFAEQAREAARRADLIVAVSEFTKAQVVDLLNVPKSQVRVVHHGVHCPPKIRQGITREKVILHVGAIQERKNIKRLVEAFEALDPDWRLELAGSFGYGAEGIIARIEGSPARERIAILGYVSPTALEELYARASIFAFPSLDEGFGIPVLEAMAAGIPVLTSTHSALPEVAGNAALLVNPEDTEELAAALQRLSEDDGLRQELTKRGFEHCSAFTWERAATETWKVYQELLPGNGI